MNIDIPKKLTNEYVKEKISELIDNQSLYYFEIKNVNEVNCVQEIVVTIKLFERPKEEQHGV